MMDSTKFYLHLLLVFACAIGKAASQQKDKDVCVKLPDGNITYAGCQKRMEQFVGGEVGAGSVGIDVSVVFEGSYPMILPPFTEEDLNTFAKVYDAIEDIPYMTRGSNNPAMEQYLAEGFHDMLQYVLTEKDGIRGYLQARTCLSKDEVREGIEECFKPYMNYTRNHPYKTIKNSDARVREHCTALKAYQQCRIEVFQNSSFCDSDMAEWNDCAFIEYYDKYAEEVHCDIDGGLSTAEIIYVALGCAGGVLVLFCLCFCASRFLHCTSGETINKNLIMAMSRTNNNGNKKKPQDKKKTTQQSNGVVNKGFDKDVEADQPKQNGKAKPVAQNDYYNTKELDNNSANERKEESGNDRRIDTIDERDERRYEDRDRRDRDYYRESPRNHRRDYARDYPRDYPRDRYPRDHRPDYSPRSGNRSGPSYDDMIHAGVHDGGPAPRNINDVRLMVNPGGLRRF